MRNLKKAFCYQKMFWPFTVVWINCPIDIKKFANSRPSASNFKSFPRSLEQFFLTLGQINLSDNIPFFFIQFTISNFYLEFYSLLILNFYFPFPLKLPFPPPFILLFFYSFIHFFLIFFFNSFFSIAV